MTSPDFAAGQTLVTAMVGPVVGDLVSTWVDNGQSVVWRVEHAENLGTLIGRGGVARTEVEHDRYREVVLLDPDKGVLAVLDRPKRQGTGSRTFDAAGQPFRIARADERTSGPGLWTTFRDWLAGVVVDTARRGEFVVVERGGWTHSPHPYALAIVTRDEEGQWGSHVESSPAPTWSTIWPAMPEDAEGQTLSAPATEDAVAAGALLLVEAVRGWAGSPMEVALTFGRNPSGPWPEVRASG